MNYNKQILIYPFLLLIFALCACSGNKPLQARYNAEKMFYEAENTLKDARALSTNLSVEQSTEITNLFTKLVSYCYTQIDQIDSSLNPVEFNEFNYITYQAVTRLSQLYFLNKNYNKCIEITNKLLTKIRIPAQQKAAVYINLGQALQSAGNWDSSYAVYNNALEKFSPPLTNTNEIIGSIFNLPLYVYRVVNYIKDKNAVSFEITKTENYYLNLVHDFKGNKLETASRSNLAKLYEETGQWKKELSQLQLLTNPTSKSYFTVLLKTADIFGGKLKKYDTALTIYNYILENTADTADDMRSILMFKKSLVQIDLGNFEQARTLLHKIKSTYPNIYNQSPLFQYNLARSFELQNNWNRAEQEYNLLLEKFKGSSESMMTLLYLVDHFKKQNNTQEKDRWFAKAESYFNELAKSGTGRLLEARAMLYLADLYNRNDYFEKSAQILTTIFEKYPETDPGKQALIKSIRLYQNKLHNPQKADSLLQQLKLTLAKTPVNSNSTDLLEN